MMSLCRPQPMPLYRPGGGLLGDDAVVAEVGVAAAAVLLGHVHAEEALLAGFQPDAAVDDLVLLPLLVERRDVAIEECPVRLAEQVVLGLEECAFVLDDVAHGEPPEVSGGFGTTIYHPTGWLGIRLWGGWK